MDLTFERTAGQKVDLIEPFPEDHLPEMHRWLGFARVISTTAEFPKDFESFQAQMREMLPKVRSWGVIDRSNGELVGVVMFEPTGLMGGKSYVAARRRSWGRGLMEEAAQIGIRKVFEDSQTLGYIFGFVACNNAPAKSFNERIGMRLKNILPDYVRQDGQLHGMLIFELTREQWQAL